MDIKGRQRQRMMGYFIDAAKEIIKEEGVKALSARKVGEKAGYSYATIYNYFSDINTLLAYCAFNYLEDCYNHMVSFKKDEDCREQIITYASAYFSYFAQNPELFQLIFLEDIGKAPEELMKKGGPILVGQLLRDNLTECAQRGYIPEGNVEILQDLIGSSIHGKLLFFLKGRNIEHLDGMIKAIRREIEFLLKCEGAK